MSIFKKLLCITIVVLASAHLAGRLQAAHIVGGDVTYSFVRFNGDTTRVVFLVEFTMYRDRFTGGADFDSPARFGVYLRNLANGWDYVQTVENINFVDREVIPIPDDPCVEEPSNVGVDKATYRFEVNLPIEDRDYMIAYQRCCRNNSIGNIIDPGTTGAAFTVQISPTAQKTGNNSPVFNQFPPIIICANSPLEFDHSAVDAEGDLLRYKFCAPLASGGTDGSGGPGSGDPDACTGVTPNPLNCRPPYDVVTFKPPFNASMPLGGDPLISINTFTGLITGTPQFNGQYVVGVCVEEFRDGELIGTLRRDFQFNVVTCEPEVFAQIEADAQIDGKEFFINSCGENTVVFKNESFDVNSITDYRWTFYQQDEVLQEVFTRDAEITFPGIGEYTGTMILNEGLECSDTANLIVNIYPSIEADFEFEYDTCVAGPVAFTDLSTTGADMLTGWTWDFDGGGTSGIQNPNHFFEMPGSQNVILVAEDNNECKDTIEKVIDWFPAPPLIIVEPSSFIGCSPAEIFFNNLSSPIDDTYDILWDFGDENTSNEISPTHIYEEEGVYSISLEITSPIGCTTEKQFPNWIRVQPGPVANFSFTPEEPNILQREVRFTDLSSNAISWQWNFSDLGNSFEQNPTYTFPDTGIYNIMLTVFHPSGCPDTISSQIDIRPVVRFFMPNAFTPNQDASNDLFLGNGFYDGLAEFEMRIWNRWGELIFETRDPRQGWNGQKDNVGEPSPQGVYVYQVRFINPRGESEELNGSVTLIR